MFYILFVTNVKHDKHTIRMMFYYDYKYAILLDKLRNGEDFIFFNLDTLYSGGWGKSPLPLDIFTPIYTIYTIFLYCFTVVCHCIHVMHRFKGKHAK